MKILNEKTIYPLFILAAALFLRLYNIYFQNPQLFSETIWIWNRSLTCVSDFSEKYVFYPNLFQLVLFCAEWIVFLIGRFFGIFKSVLDFDSLRLNNLPMFMALGRIVVIIFSASTILLVYKAGKKIKNAETGIIAMAFLAFNFFYLKESRFLYNTVPSSFFIMLNFLFIWNIFVSGRLKDYFFAGLIMGLGCSIHFQQLMLIPTLFIAHFFHEKEAKGTIRVIFSKKILLTLAVAITVFILLNPAILGNFRIFIQKFIWNSSRLFQPAFSAGSLAENGYISYFKMIFNSDRTILPLALAGIAVCFRSKAGILLSSFPLFFYLSYGQASEAYSHWIVAIVPFLALLAAYFITYLSERINFPVKLKSFALLSISLALLVPSLVSIIKGDFFIPQKNIQAYAREWVSNKIPKNVKLTQGSLLVDDQPILNKIQTFFLFP